MPSPPLRRTGPLRWAQSMRDRSIAVKAASVRRQKGVPKLGRPVSASAWRRSRGDATGRRPCRKAGLCEHSSARVRCRGSPTGPRHRCALRAEPVAVPQLYDGVAMDGPLPRRQGRRRASIRRRRNAAVKPGASRNVAQDGSCLDDASWSRSRRARAAPHRERPHHFAMRARSTIEARPGLERPGQRMVPVMPRAMEPPRGREPVDRDASSGIASRCRPDGRSPLAARITA